MKKQRVSPITNFQINSDFNGGNLPNPEDANRTIAALTGKAEMTPSVPASETEEMALDNDIVTNEIFKGGRPLKTSAAGRIKFTTMLHPDLIKHLKRTAIDENSSVADLLEIAIKNYLAI